MSRGGLEDGNPLKSSEDARNSTAGVDMRGETERVSMCSEASAEPELEQARPRGLSAEFDDVFSETSAEKAAAQVKNKKKMKVPKLKDVKGKMSVRNMTEAAKKLSQSMFVKEDEAELSPFEVPEEWKSDPLKAIQEVQKPATVDESSRDNSLYKQILYEKERTDRIKYVELFTPGTFNYKRRLWCIKVALHPVFNGVFTTLICANAITLGMNADDAIPPNASFWLESSFTVAYSFELYVRIFACPGYPWRDISIWMDGVLWVIAAVDLWMFGILEFLDIAERPNLSTFMVLRLFRITRIAKAAEKFSSVARPLRLLKNCARYVKYMAGAVFGLTLAFVFMAAVATRSNLPRPEDDPSEGVTKVTEKYFPHMVLALTNYLLIIIGGIKWAPEMTDPLQEGSLSSSITVYCSIYVIRVCVLNLVLALIVEQLLASGDDENTKEAIKKVRDKLNVGRLRKVLTLMDMNGDGNIDINELTYAYEKGAHVQKELGLPLRVAHSIHRRADTSLSQRVSINEFLEAIFYFKCGMGGVDTLLLEERLKQCQHWAERTSSEAASLSLLAKQGMPLDRPPEDSAGGMRQSGIVARPKEARQRMRNSLKGKRESTAVKDAFVKSDSYPVPDEVYAKASPRDNWAQKVGAMPEGGKGLVERVNKLLCECVGNESHLDLMQYEIMQHAQDVEANLDHFISLIEQSENGPVTQDAINMSSVYFGAELSRFVQRAEAFFAPTEAEVPAHPGRNSAHLI